MGHQKSKPLSPEAVAAIAKPKISQYWFDAAAEIFTIPNLQRWPLAVAFSGGNAIFGPQCAGLLFLFPSPFACEEKNAPVQQLTKSS